MKKILAIIILSLCFIGSSQADDIRDFEIEGISLGDSLLDKMSKEEIKKHQNRFPKKDLYIILMNIIRLLSVKNLLTYRLLSYLNMMIFKFI